MNVYSLDSDIAEKPSQSLLSRRERHRLLRRTDIIRAAEHVFAQKGFHKATIEDIASQAQYATGTVYLYFTDKNSLYFSILEEKISEILCTLRLKIGQTKGAREKLEVFVVESLRFFESNQDFFRIIAQEESRWSIESRLARSTIAQKRKDFFAELVRYAQAEGLLRKDASVRQVSDLLDSIISSYIFSWCEQKTREEKDIRAAAGVILDLFLNGVKKR